LRRFVGGETAVSEWWEGGGHLIEMVKYRKGKEVRNDVTSW
jgi:hypothetical protein